MSSERTVLGTSAKQKFKPSLMKGESLWVRRMRVSERLSAASLFRAFPAIFKPKLKAPHVHSPLGLSSIL